MRPPLVARRPRRLDEQLTLTYMALTARACHYAVEELKRGNL